MSSERHARLAQLFATASELHGADRQAFIERHCRDDSHLRRGLEALLAHEHAASRLFSGEASANVSRQLDQLLQVQDALDGYELLEVIGEGGMAVVYLAQQASPSRRVALKMIKPGFDNGQLLTRFEHERETLAALSHPNIAGIFDAGSTRAERPFFAMEYVDGKPITRYCDEHRLSLRQRIELMLPVCRAIEHAHQLGIIHRDLKPSNILVSRQSAQAIAKVIDFGIAKTLDAAGDPHMTRHGQILGTVDYMSPEQARGGGAAIDTRSDVYSLGVVLYEVLCGHLPLCADTDPALSFERIRESVEPVAPSVRLAQDAGEADTIAANRRSNAGQLAPALRGDLDCIVMRALEKTRARRYQSARELADDLQRHLDGEAVHAHPPSRRYLLGRFVRRHRLPVALTTALIVVSFVAMAGLWNGFQRALSAERQARAAETEARRQAGLANQHAASAQAVSDFLVELFELSDPGRAAADNVTARQILESGVARIDQSLAGQPRTRAELSDTLARVSMNLGLYERAEQLAEQSLALRSGDTSADADERADALRLRGLVHYHRGQFTQAEQLHREALALGQASHGAGSAQAAENLHNIATAVMAQGRYADARELFEQVLIIRERTAPAPHDDTATSLNSMGSVLRRLGEFDQAARYFERAIAMRRALGQSLHPDLAIAMSNQGVTLFNLKRYEEAGQILQETLLMHDRLYREAHPQTGTVLSNLGATLVAQDRLAEAEPVLRRSLQLHRELFGADHANTAGVSNNLATVLQRSGDPAGAERLLRDALRILSLPQNAQLPTRGMIMANLASTLSDQARHEPATALAAKAVQTLTMRLPAEHPWIAAAEATHGHALAGAGQWHEAIALLSRSLPRLEAVFGAGHRRTRQAREDLTLARDALGAGG